MCYSISRWKHRTQVMQTLGVSMRLSPGRACGMHLFKSISTILLQGSRAAFATAKYNGGKGNPGTVLQRIVDDRSALALSALARWGCAMDQFPVSCSPSGRSFDFPSPLPFSFPFAAVLSACWPLCLGSTPQSLPLPECLKVRMVRKIHFAMSAKTAVPFLTQLFRRHVLLNH